MQEFLAQTSLVLLVTAAIIFAVQTVLQVRKKGHEDASFPTVLLFVIAGWILTDVVTDALGASLGDMGR